jgi:hypothetical protein
MLQRREAVGFVGAILAHAAAFPLLGALPVRLAAGEIRNEQPTSIEIVSESAPPPEPLPSPAPSREPSPSTVVGRVVGALKVSTSTTTTAGTPADGATEPEADDRLDPGAVVWLGGAPPPMRPHLGGAGSRASSVRAATQDGVDPGREASARIERSVHDALAARDHALGLDAAGALVGLAEDCVRHGDAPLDGKGYLDVAINPDGTVASVQVVAGTEPIAGWQAVASSLGEKGRSRSVLWRRTGKPLRVRLEVSSRWVLPSGSRPGRPLTRPDVKLDETFEPPGTAGFVAAVPLAPAAAAVQTHFDVADIGARPQRDVHARILREDSP